jgi:hypothetical protein
VGAQCQTHYLSGFNKNAALSAIAITISGQNTQVIIKTAIKVELFIKISHALIAEEFDDLRLCSPLMEPLHRGNKVRSKILVIEEPFGGCLPPLKSCRVPPGFF